MGFGKGKLPAAALADENEADAGWIQELQHAGKQRLALDAALESPGDQAEGHSAPRGSPRLGRDRKHAAIDAVRNDLQMRNPVGVQDRLLPPVQTDHLLGFGVPRDKGAAA